MMRVELRDATGSLSDYARRARREPVVVTRQGKPVLVLRPLTADEWEDLVVATHPGFARLMKRSHARFKAGTAIPLEEIERELALSVPRTRSVRRRSRRSK